jgi:hypothetical protein
MTEENKQYPFRDGEVYDGENGTRYWIQSYFPKTGNVAYLKKIGKKGKVEQFMERAALLKLKKLSFVGKRENWAEACSSFRR